MTEKSDECVYTCSDRKPLLYGASLSSLSHYYPSRKKFGQINPTVDRKLETLVKAGDGAGVVGMHLKD